MRYACYDHELFPCDIDVFSLFGVVYLCLVGKLSEFVFKEGEREKNSQTEHRLESYSWNVWSCLLDTAGEEERKSRSNKYCWSREHEDWFVMVLYVYPSVFGLMKF